MAPRPATGRGDRREGFRTDSDRRQGFRSDSDRREGFRTGNDRREGTGRDEHRPSTSRSFSGRDDRSVTSGRQGRGGYAGDGRAARSDDRPGRSPYADRPAGRGDERGRGDESPRFEDRRQGSGDARQSRYGERPGRPSYADRQGRPAYDEHQRSSADDRGGRWEDRGGASSRTDRDRAESGRGRDLPNSRWQARRDTPRPDWSDEQARRDRVGSSGRWAEAREDRQGSGPRRHEERPRLHAERFRDDRPRFRDDRPRSREDRPRTWSDDRPRFRDDRPQSGEDRPRTWADERPIGEESRQRPERRWEDRPPRADRVRDDRRPGNDRFRDDRRPGNDRFRDERGPRTDRSRDDRTYDRSRTDAPQSDQMEWTAPEVTAVEATGSGFADLGLPSELTGVLAGLGITEPFPIQAATIPDALEGRDVLGRGRTGSGKTLGFGLPMLARLSTKRGLGVRGLVLVPTRELAMQVADVLAPLARATGLDVALVAGGMSYGPQLRAFERGVDVVVATPGRLVDLLDQGAASLDTVEVTVLDEADHMADLGFL
ncbi:MAG TPA: DEAD/DEAH box helicase, partial [Propionibacteriaceae bacterium]|nr:DEAD/DEAH box helicase [Propionibacteriaceae bacterium]